MSWYEQWFDTDEYDLVYMQRDEREASQLVDLIERVVQPEAGSSVLDIGCGRGRHAVEFASRGYRVTGLDLSKRSLAAAERRAAQADVDVTFVRGDMREPVGGQFDLVVNLFTAFGYFENDLDHQKAVDAMAASMAPGGRLVQDFLNADRVRASLVPSDSRMVGETEIRQRRRIDNGRIRKVIEFARPKASHTFEESVALLTVSDFEKLYQAAGLQLERLFGDYDGAAYTDTSPRTILFSRRA